jgi:hypothetical protein
MASTLVTIFNAIHSPPFSAAAELRALTPNLYHSSLCSRACPDLLFLSKVMLNTSSPPDSVGYSRMTVHEG